MNVLVQELKKENEDFEFYPTTARMIEVINNDLNAICNRSRHLSILDIGAGDGNFFNIIESLQQGRVEDRKMTFTKYAIEKSSILINKMDADIFIVGTDFHEQTLIDKKVDVIFCNPPYSEYQVWMEKIITEANSNYVYLIVPDRWKNQKSILAMIEKRGIEYKIIGHDDFLEADRQSRSNVDIIRFELREISYHNSDLKSDPFDIWFDTFFNIKAETEKQSDYESEKDHKEKIKSNLIKGQNLIERLDELYRQDFDLLLNNYKMIEKLDPEIFKELGVNVDGLKSGLKLKIQGLKNLYWHELFDNLESLTSRLTKDSRKKLFDKLTEHTNVDFTSSNAYAIVIWAIKNANVYMDEQLKAVYLWMTDKENVINYKSNKKFVEDGWRYDKSKQSHYILDYRLVFKCWKNFNPSSYGDYDYPNDLNKTTHDHINDIITIAKNLGFNVQEKSFDFKWSSGKTVSFTYPEGDFMDVKAFKNGNIHCKINQEFMKKFNIEAGRLNGWIKSPKEASEEMDIPFEEVAKYYNCNKQIALSNLKLLV